MHFQRQALSVCKCLRICRKTWSTNACSGSSLRMLCVSVRMIQLIELRALYTNAHSLFLLTFPLPLRKTRRPVIRIGCIFCWNFYFSCPEGVYFFLPKRTFLWYQGNLVVLCYFLLIVPLIFPSTTVELLNYCVVQIMYK